MKQLFLFMLSASLVLTSCSKGGDPQPETCRLKSTQEIYNGAVEQTLYYSYDDKGRVSRIDYDAEQSNEYLTITYQTGKITVLDKSDGSNEETVYSLDATGRIINDGRYTYKYNTEGYLIEAEPLSTSYPTKSLTYQNGNLVKVEETYLSGMKTTWVIEYNNEPGQALGGFESLLSNGFSGPDILATYFGKASKNQFVKVSVTEGGETRVSSATYQKDDASKIIALNGSGSGETFGYKFAYQCQ